MRIAIVGGGPAGVYFAILGEEGRGPGPRRHRLRAKSPRRHVRVRCCVLGRDARHVREAGSGKLSGDHRELCLLGRHRNPLQGRSCTASAATASAAARGRPCCDCCTIAHARSASSSNSRQEIDPDLAALADADLIVAATARTAASARRKARTLERRSIIARTSSRGWARRARSTRSLSSSRRPSTGSSSRTVTSTSPGDRPGSSKYRTTHSSAPASISSTRSSPHEGSRKFSRTNCKGIRFSSTGPRGGTFLASPTSAGSRGT